MKKLLAVAILCASGSVMALDPEAGLTDRVNGTYMFECKGVRTDNGNAPDWSLTKQNMDYLTYGIASHVVIKALNEFYAGAGDKALKAGNVGLDDGLPIEGVTR